MPQFMLLLQEHPSTAGEMSPEEIQRAIEEYTAWSEGLAAEGRLVSGAKLRDEGGSRVERVGGQVRVVDAPYAEAKEVLGGVFVIEAGSYEEAVQTAATCPHLGFGAIVVREIEPV